MQMCFWRWHDEDDEVDDDVNLQTINDVDDHYSEEIVFGDELSLPKLRNSSHQLSQEHAHGRHKDVVGSFEEYFAIIAKMKSSHDPKMSIVPSMLSNADFPPLIKNQAAHSVKSDFFVRAMVVRKTKHIWERVGTVEQSRQSMYIQNQRDGITSM